MHLRELLFSMKCYRFLHLHLFTILVYKFLWNCFDKVQ